jgi:rubrerythrin
MSTTKGDGIAGGESATGISNARYNLVSVLYHALEGGATYDKYVQDAEQEGDQELADFFRQVQQEDANRAQQAKSLLDQR